MNGKLLGWLRKDIRLDIRVFRKRTVPSPFVRRMGKVIQVLALLVLCSFVFWRALIYRDVSRRFSRIQSAGLPTSGMELNAWRRSVPDAENGALVLTQAFALFRTFPDSRSNEVAEPKLLTRTNEWTAATRALVEAYVQTNQPALEKVRGGLLLSRFRYPVDFSYGPETELPHLAALKKTAHIIALQTVLETEAGHAGEWPDNVTLELKLARTLDDEPIAISYLVRSAII